LFGMTENQLYEQSDSPACTVNFHLLGRLARSASCGLGGRHGSKLIESV
jgi:hypothetical protein